MQHRYVKCALLAFLKWVCWSGCGGEAFLEGDAAAGDGGEEEETGPLCLFSASEGGVNPPFSCTIGPDTRTACVDALDCLCRAWQGSTDRSSVDLCIGWELVPRDSISMADFCFDANPARFTIEEALEFYLVEYGVPEEAIVFSPECAAIPALAGPLAYYECAFLDGLLCPCIPGECSVNLVLDSRCLDLSRDEVWCVYNTANEDPAEVCENLEIIDFILSGCAGG